MYTLLHLQGLSKELAATLKKDTIVMLSGDLGVGKTTLVSSVLKHLVDDEEDFTSPTFNIVHEYYSNKKQYKIFHFDLYRIKNKSELYEIGFCDMLSSGLSFIEWPEVALPIIIPTYKDRLLKIHLSFENDSTRRISMHKN